MNDVAEGGGLACWAEGPEKLPWRHVGQMVNADLVGDNRRLFPPDEGRSAGGRAIIARHSRPLVEELPDRAMATAGCSPVTAVDSPSIA